MESINKKLSVKEYGYAEINRAGITEVEIMNFSDNSRLVT
jgi:hypothetical protein